jgi:phenylpyruvate tautomerase PptA (4-oxalocrotonate tautomerase family)
MPFIESKISVKATEEQNKKLKERLGQAISMIPGKSESWLMVNLQDDQKMYFRGDDSAPIAFIAVTVYGSANSSAFSKMTGELTKIYGDLFGIAPDHIYVKYATTMDWGWNGSNF